MKVTRPKRLAGSSLSLAPDVGWILKEADYYSPRDEYIGGATGLPTYISSIQIDGISKTVKLLDVASSQNHVVGFQGGVRF